MDGYHAFLNRKMFKIQNHSEQKYIFIEKKSKEVFCSIQRNLEKEIYFTKKCVN